jgi:hypothetical protein
MLSLILAGVISLVVNPQVCMAPCNITVILRVEPAKDNEKVVLELEGEFYSRVSNLDYSNGGPKTTQITYPAVPGGDYEIRASLHKHDGKSWVAGVDKKKVEVRDVGQD